MTIWKFPIQITEYQELVAPAEAQMLSVQVQAGQPCIWMYVDPANATEERAIWVYGTGHTVPPGIGDRFIGTFQVHGGALIFHVFDGGSK